MNKKYSFKEFTLIYFILLILIFPLLKKSIFASEKVQVNFHYKRFNEDYSDWNLWVWEEGKSGATKYFEKSDEYGKISTIEFIKEKDVTYLGFLLKKGDWVDKDITKDRHIPLTEKKIDVYLLQGDENIYSKVGDVDLRPAIKSAELSALNEVSFKLTNPISLLNEEDIKKIRVTDHLGKEFKVQKILVENKERVLDGTIRLEKNLDIKNQYFLDIWGNKKAKIVINGVFSDKDFEKKYSYSGDDLGVIFTKENSKFLLWAPTAQKVTLNIYEEGSGDNLIKSLPLEERGNGVWGLIVNENLENKYYTYTVTVGEESREVVDIYAKGVGINGDRGMILDLEKTNPIDWKSHKKPIFINPTDAIVYEVHIRDFSIDESSGIKNKGKFLGMVEQGTKNKEGESTGVDYLKELGVTHVQILPFFDFASIDETKIDTPHFNWGYDPKNYNVPEGSYSTNPYDGRVRVKELKEMIKGLHENGIRVIMDVVYNHTAASHNSYFNLTVPNYFYRMDGENFSNASACGNETASERAMVRKYIVDSVVYWAKEYKVDGFRFDLMGIHDIETMNEIKRELNKIDPTIIIYGEPWAAGNSPLPSSKRALKENTYLLNNVGVFNDDIRDGIKGSVFDSKDTGFATGKNGMEERVKFGIVGAVKHPQVKYTKPWANSPSQSVNYVSAHDNLTLWDKISSSKVNSSLENRLRMNKLSQGIVSTSQGVVFIHAGEEILRSKPLGNNKFDENSYKSDEKINSIKWQQKGYTKDMNEYYKGLITFRKNNPGLRMNSQEKVEKNIIFKDNIPKNVIAYTIKADKDTNQEKDLFIIHNGRDEKVKVTLPNGEWEVYVNGKKAGIEVLERVKNKIDVEKISTYILKKR